MSWLISKLTTCQDDDQQCQHTSADREGQICVGYDLGGEKWLHDTKGVIAGMQQDGDEDAAFRVIEDPGKDDGQCHNL